MKNFTLLACAFFFCIGNTLFSQQERGIVGDSNWLNNWTEFSPNKNEYREADQILTGVITEDQTLYKKDIYLLVGSVFVAKNVTLTIEPGTVIIGQFESKGSLTIAKGAKIIAEGRETDPIVFTSENSSIKKPGDWGGLIILGEAPDNKYGQGSIAQYYKDLSGPSYASTGYGGDSINDNSGILKYVRIEYAGRRLKGVGYTNGLLLACVGNQTQIENVMVSYSAGDSFEVWGGDVNLKKLVSYKAKGNDYNFSYGAQCELTNSLAVRSPYLSNGEGSRCLEVSSYKSKEGVDFSKKGTSILGKNLTFLNTSADIDADIDSGLVKESVYIGEFTSLDMSKSVISGFKKAVLLQETIAVNQKNLDKIKFSNMHFLNCRGNIFTEYRDNNDDLENWFGNPAFFNFYDPNGVDNEIFIKMRDEKRPDFRIRIDKIGAAPNR